MEARSLDNGRIILDLSADEVMIILAGLREANQELEDWEFQTRTGFEREEMNSLHDAIYRALRELGFK